MKDALEAPFIKGDKDRGKVLTKLSTLIGIDYSSLEKFTLSLPFSLNDVTAGVENELQTVVVGSKEDVDLPVTIRKSNYYKNIMKRAASGDTPRHFMRTLDEQIDSNSENVWDNSWVRFPRSVLSPFAQQVFDNDLLADKQDLTGPKRSDADRFFFQKNGEEFIRIPVSYFLKLTLADAISSSRTLYPPIRTFGERLMAHFSNDNTSPETFSFYPVPLRADSGMGKAVARETLRRFLLCQFLTMYGNRKFKLLSQGQEALVFFASHPPTRQKN